LRKQLGTAVKSSFPGTKYQLPDIKYSLDNASMIAVAGYFKYALSKNKKAFYNNWRYLEANAGLKITK
jgi:tRNA A37 threonylcarbamoyltransferase TsaD